MRYQWLEVNQAFSNKHDRFLIRLSVPKLELNVDLSEGGIHERIFMERLASDSDDKDFAAKSRGLSQNVSNCPLTLAERTHVYSGMYTALHPGALDYKLCFLSECFFDRRCDFFCTLVLTYKYCPYARYKGLRHFQTKRV